MQQTPLILLMVFGGICLGGFFGAFFVSMGIFIVPKIGITAA